jgi:hypothetical protein
MLRALPARVCPHVVMSAMGDPAQGFGLDTSEKRSDFRWLTSRPIER